MRKINEIIIHCAYTPITYNVGVDTIREWHVDERNMSDIAYNYVIKLDGTIEQGRPLDKIGAHCKGKNRNTIGICYAGGMGMDLHSWKDTRTPEQLKSLESLITALKTCFPTIVKVSSHSDYADKLCPCFDAHKEYNHLVK